MSGSAKLTKAIHRSIVDALEGGAPFNLAAEASGVLAEQARSWLELGAEPGSRYRKFLLDCRQAMARSEIAGLQVLAQAAAAGEWKAAAWWLERYRPERWSLRVRQVVMAELEKGADRIEAMASDIGAHRVERILAALAGELGGEEAAPTKTEGVH